MNKARTYFLLRLTPKGFPPLVASLFVFIALMAILTVIFHAEGIARTFSNYEFFALFGLAFAYLVFVTRVIHNAHVRDYGKLLTHAELDQDEKELWADKIHTLYSQRTETLIAVGVGLLHAYLQGYGRILEGQSRFVIYDIWAFLHIILIWIMITLSTSIFIRNMTLINELSEKVKIDLLNMDRFMPLTRSGVWSILGFIGVYSILFVQGVKGVDITDPAVLVLIPSIIWMIRTPLKGFRKRVITAKEAELKKVDAAIEGDRSALNSSRIRANLDNINVIDLINYKKMIQNTLEIPVNIPTASRFAFYLIIPLLTWVAASMVDKVVDYLIR